MLCNASVCNPVIYAPRPFGTNAAVGWLKHLNISMQCAGNGVDWESGNTLRISDSVIEGYAQYGVRAGIKRGGYGGFELENVYEEVGSCTNPAGAIGEAGVIAQGATVKVEGGTPPAGTVPQFTNTGSTDYRYYVVAQHATYGASNPLYAGRALTNGSGNITVTWPDVPGASAFDLLRVTFVSANNPREQAPYGTGNYAVATNVSRATACSNGVCTFTDTQAALSAYTVATPTYFPLLDYWPGNLVLVASRDSNSALDAATAWLQNAPSDMVGVQGMAAPAVIAGDCQAVSYWTPLWLSCYTSMAPGTFYEQGALLMAVKPNQDSGLKTNLKGRLNFPMLGTGPGHIITLSDSNFQKTVATANNRPTNDASDAYIGYDQGDGNPAHVGISMGAPVSLSNYIGNVGDGTYWLERLTSGLKEFKVPVQMDSSLTIAGTAQASSFATTASGQWAVQGNYGTLSAAPAGKSGIGFGPNGKVQVSENGGTVVEVAKLDSNGNVSENANTATQLAQNPTQCSGSFVTGIQENGNANCSTADEIQLAETSQPSGIPTYGIFWFDSTCHCPKVIDNNGQPVQLGLLNVFNTDANTLEEYNGTTPQTLNIYGTRADASDYERIRLGYDAAPTDQYFFIGSDAAGSGTQRGFGIWMQNSLRWVWDTSFNFKPWSDNLKDVGSPTLRLKHLYVGTYADLTSGALATDVPNQGTTGTTLNKLAKVTGSPASAVIASTSDTSGIIGVVVDGAGTTGSAQIARGGEASCVFDGATTAGDYVQISNTIAGECHDAGTSYPGSGQVLGRVLSTNSGTGTYAMLVGGPEVQAAAGGGAAVTSVFGRTGAVVAQTGDYSVSQVTGAALDSAVVHLAGTETITGAKTFSSDVSVPNLNVSGQINMTQSGAFKLKAAYGLLAADGDPTKSTIGFDANGNFAISVEGGTFFNPVPNTTTVNGHSLSANVTVSASDLTTGTLPHAQLPTLLSGDIPNNAANTTGTAANLSGTPALPNGTTATTQSAGDNSTKLATTAYVDAGRGAHWSIPGSVQTGTPIGFDTNANKAYVWAVSIPYPLKSSNVVYYVQGLDSSGNTYDIGIYDSGGNLKAHIGPTAGSTFSATSGLHTAAWTSANVVLQPGIYFVAITCSATSGQATLGYGYMLSWVGKTEEAVSSGGTLGASVTVPSSPAWSSGSVPTVAFY